MLVTADGGIKLADFGVAAQLQSSIAKRSTVIGTPHWMAPEMLDQMEQYDNKVDIWGIGITAIELAQLKPPFFEMETMPAMRRITMPAPQFHRPRRHRQPHPERSTPARCTRRSARIIREPAPSAG